MRVDVDFESYAAARWHLLVRTLVLLGVPPGHAATLTREALAQRRSQWSHQDAFDDLDAELYRTVLDLKHHDDRAWWAEPPFDDELWTELEPELDRLTPAQREWLVLRHVAELPESYIAAVVGKPDPGARSGVPSEERLRDVVQVVPVQSPDLEQVAAMAGELRRRQRRRGFSWAVGLLGLAAVVALIAAFAAGDPDDAPARELDRVSVARAATGAAVGWYADGKLHLSNVVIDLPNLRAVATINDGAVYTDHDGDLLFVNDQGQRTLLATIGEQGTFVASDEDGLVAWLSDDEDAELVVRDLTARSDVVRVDVQGAGEVIAIDNGSVFFRDDRGDHEVTLESGEMEPQGVARLLDVASTARVHQETPSTIRMEQPLFDAAFIRPGEGAQVSEEGLFVLTWVGGDLAVYDTRTGDGVAAVPEPDERALDAEFGPGSTITYLVMERSASSGIVNIRTCWLGFVSLPPGVGAPECRQEVAGTFRGVDTDLQLAR